MNKQKWILKAQELGIQEFEIYQNLSYEKEVTWFNGTMDKFETSKVLGTYIRGIIDGNMSNMYLEQVDDDNCDYILHQLINQISIINSKEKDTIRQAENIEPIKKDTQWLTPSMDDVYKIMEQLEKKTLEYDERVIQVAHESWNEAKETISITNSKGIDLVDEDQLQYLAMSVVVQQGQEIKDYTEIEILPDLSQFKMDEFISRTVDKALLKLNSKSYPSMTSPVIFTSDAMRSLFSSFMGLFSGDLIHKGLSCLKGKENTQIFSKDITIIDNPRNLDALCVRSFDDEGCPTSKKTLVDQGVFKLALQSTKSANRLGLESTGNGFRSGSDIAVQPLNCCIMPQDHSFEQMCEQMNEGLVIESVTGLHAGIDFVSTNFSLQASGYSIKNGKRNQSISLITVAGNFMELMNDVEMIGNDLDWKYHTIACPSIYFKKCAISGE